MSGRSARCLAPMLSLGLISASLVGLTSTFTPTAVQAATASATTTPALTPRKILAVKIPNTSTGDFPQVGLPNADVVYTELVEGGLTRHVGLFSSSIPPVIEPIRSLRETDLQLLPAFGKIGIAFSGADTGVASQAASSGLVRFSEQIGSPQMYRDKPRCTSNGFLSCVALNAPAAMAKLTGTTTTSAAAKAVVLSRAGLPSGSVPANAPGVGITRLSMRFPQALTATYSKTSGDYTVKTGTLPSTGRRWNAGTRTWTTTPLTASSVILQSVSRTKVREAYACRPSWQGGSVAVYRTNTVGAGRGVLLRGGKAYPIGWTRSSATGVTSYYHLVTGHPAMKIAGDRPWVFLLPDTATASMTASSGTVYPWTPGAKPSPPDSLGTGSSRSCAHRVTISSYPFQHNGSWRVGLRLRDDQLSIAGSAVSSASDIVVTMKDATGKLYTSRVGAGGAVWVPAAMMSTGWVRVSTPARAATASHPRYAAAVTTVLRNASAGRGTAVTGTSTWRSISVAQSLRTQLTAGGKREVLMWGAYFGALSTPGPVSFYVQRRPLGTTAWTTASAAQTTLYHKGAAVPNSSAISFPVWATVAYEVRTVMQTADGHIAASPPARVGPAARTVTWAWAPAVRVGHFVQIKPAAAKPYARISFSSQTPTVCRITGTTTKYVKGISRGTCRIVASTSGDAYVLPGRRTVSFRVSA